MSMLAEGRASSIGIGYLERLIYGNDLKFRLEDSITNAVKDAFEGYEPNYVPGFNGWHVYSHSIHNARDALREYGFRFDKENNQARLLSKDHFSVPVRLRFARGRLLGGTVLFNSAKGPETHKGVRQNYQHFRRQTLLLRPETVFPSMTEKVLNLWAIYDFSREWLDAWLVMGTETQNKSMIFCDEHVVVCSKSLAKDDQPHDVTRPEPVGVEIEFSERNAKTG